MVAWSRYLDHHGVPFVTAQAGDGGQHVLDVAMTPVLPFNFGDGCDVASTESVGFAG